VLERVRQYRGGGPADDDVTLLTLHHNAADPPAKTIKVLGKMIGLVKV